MYRIKIRRWKTEFDKNQHEEVKGTGAQSTHDETSIVMSESIDAVMTKNSNVNDSFVAKPLHNILQEEINHVDPNQSTSINESAETVFAKNSEDKQVENIDSYEESATSNKSDDNDETNESSRKREIEMNNIESNQLIVQPPKRTEINGIQVSINIEPVRPEGSEHNARQYDRERKAAFVFHNDLLCSCSPMYTLGIFKKETEASLYEKLSSENGLWKCSLQYKSEVRDIKATGLGENKKQIKNNCAEAILAHFKEAVKSSVRQYDSNDGKTDEEISDQYQLELSASKLVKNGLEWYMNPSWTLREYGIATKATVKVESSNKYGLFECSMRYKSALRDFLYTATSRSNGEAINICARRIISQLVKATRSNLSNIIDVDDTSEEEQKKREIKADDFLVHSRLNPIKKLRDYGRITDALVDLDISEKNGLFECILRYKCVLRDVQTTSVATTEQHAVNACAEEILIRSNETKVLITIKHKSNKKQKGIEGTARSILNNELLWYESPSNALDCYVTKTKASLREEQNWIQYSLRYESISRDIKATTFSRSKKEPKNRCAKAILATLKEITMKSKQLDKNKQRKLEADAIQFFTRNSLHPSQALNHYVKRTWATLDANISKSIDLFKCSLRYKNILRDIHAVGEARLESEAVNTCIGVILAQLKVPIKPNTIHYENIKPSSNNKVENKSTNEFLSNRFQVEISAVDPNQQTGIDGLARLTYEESEIAKKSVDNDENIQSSRKRKEGDETIMSLVPKKAKINDIETGEISLIDDHYLEGKYPKHTTNIKSVTEEPLEQLYFYQQHSQDLNNDILGHQQEVWDNKNRRLIEQYKREAQAYEYLKEYLPSRKDSKNLRSYVKLTKATLKQTIGKENKVWMCTMQYKSVLRDIKATATEPSKEESIDNCADYIVARLLEATKSITINHSDAIEKSDHDISVQYQLEVSAFKYLKNDLKWSEHPLKTLENFATKTNATVSVDSSQQKGLFKCSLLYKSILRDIRATAKAQSNDEAKDQCAKEILTQLKEVTPSNLTYNSSIYEREQKKLEVEAQEYLTHSRDCSALTLQNYGEKTNATIDLNISKEKKSYKCTLQYRNILRDIKGIARGKNKKKALDQCAREVLATLKGAISASTTKYPGKNTKKGDVVKVKV